MATSSNRHPIVLLGGAASLITVLSFFGVRGWTGTQPPAPVASTSAGVPTTAAAVTMSSAPAPAPSSTCRCPTVTPTPATPTPAPPPSPPPVTVSCVIEDRLGDGQVAESVVLRFGTKKWELEIDESDRSDRLTLRFPHAGSYHYSVETVTETTGGITLYGSGEGTIACRGGQTFQLVGDYGDYGGGQLTVALQEA